ncbi:MAG: glutaminyl-peptide cyclotransferase [Dehalococcoidia bacterium]|nr:MAG: glutaminyl-peptide cyclotransferase [Dehalococcoidia bacterium]
MNRRLRVTALGFWALVSIVLICSCSTAEEPLNPANCTYRIINTYPHDQEAFTQGLVFHDGSLYESTGLKGSSSLRRVDLETGDVLEIHEMPDHLFGEGITIYKDNIVQLTWKANIGYVYDKDSFQLLQTFSYPTEGWGITHDGEQLIMSDGTSILHFLDPETYEETGRIEVLYSGNPVVNLNELEYIRGYIFSNVWLTDNIIIIDPFTGQVEGWIDMHELLSEEDQQGNVNVLNGIAYDSEHDRLFVTGKLWPKLFEIELIPEE